MEAFFILDRTLFCVGYKSRYDSFSKFAQSSTMDKFKKVFLAVLTALCIAGWFRFTHGWAIWLQVLGTVVIVIAFSSLSELFGK